jgi:nucleoside-diphosphate-sugar epimerase
MNTAVVSGNEGFVGRHISQALEREGFDVDGFDIKTGLDARDWFRNAYADEAPDVFVHCAAVVGGRANIDGKPLSVAQNFSIDAECIQWALRCRPRKLVLFSSSAAYPIDLQDGVMFEGTLPEYAIRLDDIEMPDQVYGTAKLVLEMQAEKVREAGLDVIILRPFSGWGEDQDLTYPMPSFIERAKRRDDPFQIWSDGEQVRDWLHIDDICDAILTMVRQDISGTVNLCSGVGTSFNDLAGMLCEIVGYSPEFQHILSAPKGVQYRVGDPARMNQFYLPKFNLRERLEQAIHA